MLGPVDTKKKINSEWHEANPMPQKPKREQRVRWHYEHAKTCGCRPVPESLRADVATLTEKEKFGPSK